MKLIVDTTLPPRQFNRALIDAARDQRAQAAKARAEALAFDEALRLFARFGWTGHHAVEMAQAEQRLGSRT